jgi:Fe-S oxidoreductase
MAGSFGYESEHYSMSRAIAGLLGDQIANSSGEQVVAPGASCRSQLADDSTVTDSAAPPHPVEALADALPE